MMVKNILSLCLLMSVLFIFVAPAQTNAADNVQLTDDPTVDDGEGESSIKPVNATAKLEALEEFQMIAESQLTIAKQKFVELEALEKFKMIAESQLTIAKQKFEELTRMEVVIEKNRLLLCGVGMQKHVSLATTTSYIKDDQITASSYYRYRAKCAPSRARLFGELSVGAWRAGTDDAYQWIEVDLKVAKIIYGISTQGGVKRKLTGLRGNSRSQNGGFTWVTEYTMKYKPTGASQFQNFYKPGQAIIFAGNTDGETPVTQTFPAPVTGQVFRVLPRKWNYHISMRFDLLTC